MKFETTVDTALLDAASDTAGMKRPLPAGTQLGDAAVSNEKWLSVNFGPRDDQKGFVLKADCKETVPVRETVDRRGVVDKAVLVEVKFNDAESIIAPWYVSADYLIARAIIETGVTNAGPMIANSDAVGPMQVSSKEWDDFLQNGGALVGNLKKADRDDPLLQISGAAFRMHSDLKAMSDLRTKAGSADPFVPQFLDVFFAYITDSPGAALALRDAAVTSENQKEVVTKFLSSNLDPAQISALLKARERFFGPEANVKTLGDVINGVKTALDTALDRAFQDIKLFIPEAVPIVSVPELAGAGTTFGEKAPVIMRQLIADFGFKDFQAAGILGNFGRETGGFTLFQERHPVGGGAGGIGWAQWTGLKPGERRAQFENFCSANGLDTKSDKGNYAFLKHEMTSTSEKKVVPLLKATTTIDQATETFMTTYERPGVKALGERITWAKRALAAFAGVGTLGTDAQALQQQINTGKIIFDSPELKSELLGLNTGTKVSPKLQALILAVSKMAPVIRISSLVRSGTGSHHTEGRAVDIGNEEIAGNLLPKIATAAQVAALGIDELIFNATKLGNPDPNAFNFDEGKKHPFDEKTINAHGDHIHFAVF